jgi:hypothetical protein
MCDTREFRTRRQGGRHRQCPLATRFLREKAPNADSERKLHGIDGGADAHRLSIRHT